MILIGAAVVLRRRRSETGFLIPPTLALCALQLLYGSYFFGIHTSVFSGLTVVASWAVGLILFERRAMAVAVIGVCIVLLGISVAEQAQWLPYAPLFGAPPFHAGRLDTSWLIGFGGVTFAMMLVIGTIIYFVIERWQDREQKLATASEQLTRANDVISRYVASQLVEQVRAGNHASLERHERRRLTLFFSDIEDFAVTADLMEPEDLSALLNEYLSEMTAIAERHGATIDKFVGDAIMIFFGAPAASSDRDQALAAVRMAIDMQERLSALRPVWAATGIEKPFRVRIGINTGQASVGAFGSRTRLEYTAIGRQVNLAARIQAQCEPDRILVSHATWVLIRDAVDGTAKGEISLKGIHQPVRIYEVRHPQPGEIGDSP
jgi:class 3 adenylate cyclase/multidrug transporter EmrE-like cation transporter